MTADFDAAKRPVAAPAAAVVGVVLALVLIAAGVVAGRDVLVRAGALTGTPWTTSAIDWVDGLTAEQWMFPAGIGAAVVGLLLVIAALKPRRKTHQPTTLDGVWLRDGDVLHLARRSAADCDGVETAVATGRGRKVKIRATAAPGADKEAVRKSVDESVSAALSTLLESPRTVVKIKTGDAK